MQVLLIEDEEAVVREIASLLESKTAADVAIARSRDAALDLIELDEDYDLIICDLRLPTIDGGLDLSEDHGFLVHDTARMRYPGTPCVFFSGFVSLANVGQRLAAGPPVDLLGTGELWPLVEVRPKDEQPEFLERAAELAAGLAKLDSLELEQTGVDSLSIYEARPFRVFTRRLGGERAVLSPLGGLSGAKVFRCEIFDASQVPVGLVVAKVGLIADVSDEISRYRQHVAPVIGIGAFAPSADDVLFGAGRYGAVFYSLAADGYRDLFDLATADSSAAAAAVARAKDLLEVWDRGEARSDVSIGELRSASVSDSRLVTFTDELDMIGWREVESVIVDMRTAVQHGDLHGRNLLVDVEGSPLIIDYGDVGPGPAVLDPVTLELSFLLHDEHPDLEGWPTIAQANDWFDLDRYVEDSPVEDVVRVCRGWATAVGSHTEVAAMVYAHAVRQLKYRDTDKALALAIAGAAVGVVLASDE